MENSLFLKALSGENQGSRPPVWIMRQAGRYMASYRKIKEKYSLLEMFSHQDLIVEISLLPIKELGVDAAIIFSDILLPLQILGYQIGFDKNAGPKVSPQKMLFPSKDVFSIERLQSHFSFLENSLQALRKELTVPLIGFCGAPFTLASYILEPHSHHLMKETKRALYQEPELFFSFLDLLADLIIEYALFQYRAGAQVIQIFDSWAGVLDRDSFVKCSSFYLSKIVSRLKRENIPVIIFCRGSSLFVKELIDVAPKGISFDWHRPLEELARQLPRNIALQGNLDPDVLKAPLRVIQEKTKALLHAMKEESRFIANLGHGISPDLPFEGVKCFVDTVKEFTYQ